MMVEATESTPLSPQRLNTCKMLSETHRQRMRQRNGETWRVIFSALTFYVVASGAILQMEGGHTLGKWRAGIILVAYAIVGLATILFMLRASKGNRTNVEIAELAESVMLEDSGSGHWSQLQRIYSRGSQRRGVQTDRHSRLCDCYFLSEAAVVVAFALTAGAIALAKP